MGEAADVAQGAGAVSAILAAVDVGAVFDDQQIVRAGEVEQCIHVGEPHGQVNGKHGLGLRGDAAPNALHVQTVGVRVDVGEDRHASGKQHGGGGAVPGIGRDDHLVSEADAGGLQGDHQGDGAVGQSAAISGAMIGCELLREFGGEAVGEWEAAPIAALQDLQDTLLVAISKQGPGVKRLAPHPVSRPE